MNKSEMVNSVVKAFGRNTFVQQEKIRTRKELTMLKHLFKLAQLL